MIGKDMAVRVIFTTVFGLVGLVVGTGTGIVGGLFGAIAGKWLFIAIGSMFGLFAGPDLSRAPRWLRQRVGRPLGHRER